MAQEDFAPATLGAETATNYPVEHTQFENINGQLQEFSLPRADGGKDAWLFLAGCFTLEALIWGQFFKHMASGFSSSRTNTCLHLSELTPGYARVSLRIRCVSILLQYP